MGVLQLLSIRPVRRRWTQALSRIAIAAAMAASDALSLASQIPPSDSAPGRLVDVGGYRLHMFCRGSAPSGGPTVVLSAGSGDLAIDWWRVQAALADSSRVCAYDRAGSGWSDLGPEPRTLRQEAAELDLLLKRAGERGPYVLVGHSLGAQVVRLYQAEHPREVVGMVLVAPTHETHG